MLPSISSTKLTWTEIKHFIKRSQESFSIVNLPSYFTFQPSPLFSNTLRMYFLSTQPGHLENTLKYSDLKPDINSDVPYIDSFPLFEMWKPVNYENMSKEEELLRERKRLRSFGISAYDNVELSFTFCAGAKLYFFNENFVRKIPEEVIVSTDGSPMDPKICPVNENFISYISNNDIYVSSLSQNKTIRLTYTRDEKKSWLENSISAGVPSFITQEELERFTGYWWRPDYREEEDGRLLYSVLYEEVDESQVNILYIISPETNGISYDQYRYPRAGQNNSISNLKLVEFYVKNDEIKKIVHKELENPLSKHFPTMEYLLNAGWISQGMRIFVLMSNRRQQKFTLASISYESFVQIDHFSSNTIQPNIVILFEETSNTWLHTHNLFNIIPSADKDILNFVFPSENSGFMHLQLVQVDCNRSRSSPLDLQTQTFRAKINSIRRLTKGNWNVDSKELWIDSESSLIYFMAYKETPLEMHLYITSYDKESDVTRLTRPNYSHNIEMDERCNYFVSAYSSLRSSTCEVFQIIHENNQHSAKPFVTLFHSNRQIIEMKISIELFSYKSISDHEMHGVMYKSTKKKKVPTATLR